MVKIPFDRSDTIEAVTTDTAVSSFVRALGLQAAELIALDTTRKVVPVPVAIFRRVDGVPLDPEDRSDAARAAWEEVGRQLARVHAITDRSVMPIALREFRQTPEVDPRPWVDELHVADVLDEDDTRWLRALLERIAPAALADVTLTFCHGDVNAANVLVDAETGRFRALIDWAGAGWLDPVWDFAGVPLGVVPWMLEGHRGVASLPEDANAEARICWCQAQTRLFAVRNTENSDDTSRQVRRHVEQLRRYVQATGVMSSP